MLEMGPTAPALMTMSLTFELSPAIFPRPQIAYSITSRLLELSKPIKTFTVPLSNKT